MSLYFESQKPVTSPCTIQSWRDHTKEMRKLLEGKDGECRDLRNESRRLRYETTVTKTWDLYYNNIKLHDKAYEIEVLILYAETMLPQLASEKKLVEEEKSQSETLMNKCDTWIGICLEGLNSLDRKLENELTRDDEGVEETKKSMYLVLLDQWPYGVANCIKKSFLDIWANSTQIIKKKAEIALLENAKANLKADNLLAWEMICRLEDVETKIELNLEFKREVLAIDVNCQAISKMDTDVSYKVEATKGPKKMLTIEEWSKAVYGLVELGQKEISESMKLRERMLATRGVTLNEYSIQFDKTDYAMRKRTYEINREKNESQYQLLRVDELMAVTQAEWTRLNLFLRDVKDDLRCAETRCSNRYFRPSVDATIDPPFVGMNKEVMDLRTKVEEIENHLDALKTFYNKVEEDRHKLNLEYEAKNKALQIQIQALDIRIAERYDPKKLFAYDPKVLMSKMITQMPPFFSLYSSKI